MGAAVPFNGTSVIVGTDISQTNNTTFLLGGSGVYRVSVILRTAVASLLGGVQIRRNGSGISTTATLAAVGTALVESVTFSANAGDTIQVVVTGLALTLSSGTSASITIDRISP